MQLIEMRKIPNFGPHGLLEFAYVRTSVFEKFGDFSIKMKVDYDDN